MLVIYNFLCEQPLLLLLDLTISLMCLYSGLLLFVNALLLAKDESCDHSNLLNILGSFEMFQYLHEYAFSKWVCLPNLHLALV